MYGSPASAGFEVREAGPGDVDAIARLIAILMAHHRTAPGSSDRLVEAVQRVIGSGSATFLVATVAGEIVGTVQVQRRFSTWQAAEYFFLEDFCVLPEWRSQGVGTALLEAVARHGRATGAVAIRLDLHEANVRAAAFYRRAGFTDLGYRLLDLPL